VSAIENIHKLTVGPNMFNN